MTTYMGAALCYDSLNLPLYENACIAANELGNSWKYAGFQFNCFGILMERFWEALVDGGEVNACVCSFEVTDPPTFYDSYGPCNGACIAQSYTCNGLTPEVLVARDAGNVTTPAASSTSSGASSTTTSFGVPLEINWKALLGVATVMLINAVA